MIIGFIGTGIMGRPMAANDRSAIVRFCDKLARVEVRK